MKNYLSVVLTGALVCAGSFPEGAYAQESQASGQAGKPATAPEQKPAEPVKPVAACGFCLEDGTKVPLELGRELSSAKEATGNRVDFVVTEDIKIKDVLVAPKGSVAMGTIVEAQAKRRMGRAGKLNVRIEEVRLLDGSRAKLRAIQDAKGQGRQGVMTAAMIGTGILFFPAAPIFLFMKGKDIVIAKGAPVTAYVDGDTVLDAAKFTAEAKPAEQAKPAEAGPAGGAMGPAKEGPIEPAPSTPPTTTPPPSTTTPPPGR
jgi:hypothetical protein